VTDADKKNWSTPMQRIPVMMPEERVLANSKHSYQSFSGPGGQDSICAVYVYCIGRCSTAVGS
jgi:hypothetical protein